jgi:hypothetical protein
VTRRIFSWVCVKFHLQGHAMKFRDDLKIPTGRGLYRTIFLPTRILHGNCGSFDDRRATEPIGTCPRLRYRTIQATAVGLCEAMRSSSVIDYSLPLITRWTGYL